MLERDADTIRLKNGASSEKIAFDSTNAFYSAINELQPKVLYSNPLPITGTQAFPVATYSTAQVSDSNLVSDNIKKNTTILGITGTYEGGGGNPIAPRAYYSSTITSFSSNATAICDMAFCGCSKLTSVSFEQCKYIDYSAFSGCTSLTTVSFPACSYIVGAFAGCSSLTTVSFPACTNIGSSAFSGCTYLTTVSFPVCSYIGSNAFKDCIELNEIYLMSTSRVALPFSTAFSNTGITSSTGSIYVPTSLVTAYQSATNWSYFSTQFVGVE